MTRKDKIQLIFAALFAAVIIGSLANQKQGSAAQLNVPVYNSSYFSTNSASTSTCTVLSYGAGTVHSMTVGFPAASSEITLYDSATSLVTPMTNASASIFVGPVAGATSTASGTISLLLNGQNVVTASVGNGSSTTDAATAITTAITASSSVLGVVATSTTNVVVVTASAVGSVGNINLPAFTNSNGFVFYNTLNPSRGTQIISQTALTSSSTNYSAPQTALYDVAFRNGLCIQEITATSSITVSWQQQ